MHKELCHSKLEDHSSAVAAPIFDVKGNVVAGLSLAGSDMRFQQEHIAELSAKVMETAKLISSKLGWKQSWVRGE
ncbi:IclR family transcriptional regulator domain-containing protein [Paenibacillus agricola]|uniref:IclR-ED domain-containing protein n=1 Tax=Paenibacillus agricola TaxID=2716264 RepID=A0ABX0J439_9BACL|nr:IclR family transcriptional regulator C-terminal domain-containing protein [Paenibacillus agricola]NHN30591.1 hypothetical protein [Paenibacillus agricola]